MKFKRICSALLACAVVVGAMPLAETVVPEMSVIANAAEYTEGTYDVLNYKNYGDHIEISGSNNSIEGEVVIPSEIDGVSVTKIGGAAFLMRSGITSVVIPDSVTVIDYNAFNTCTKLQSVTIPDSVTRIEFGAFAHCSALTSVKIPAGLTTICQAVFADSGLTSIAIPANVTAIESQAFQGCENLESVTIENPNCEIAGSNSFANNGVGSFFNGKIFGYFNSPVRTYAEKYASEFVPMDIVELGDVNIDGEVNAVDASLVLSDYAVRATGGSSTFYAIQVNAANVNKDSNVDAVDASSILSYYAYKATGGTDLFEDFLK